MKRKKGKNRKTQDFRRTLSTLLSTVMISTTVLSGMPMEVSAAPETVAGGYELDMDRVPMVHFSRHKNWETLYKTAWECHKNNITEVTQGLNPTLTSGGNKAYYVDEAFDNRIFQWDTLFMMMFDKYGNHEFPTLNSMDNFYCHQWDTDDESNGYISRMIWESDGSSYYNNYKTVDAINPPMFAWAEWEQYKIHGDVSRFTKVINGKTILERLDSYFQFLKRTRTHQSGPAKGLYVSNGQGNGLDNTPNQDYSGWGQAANDMSLQQVQAADYISRIAGEVLEKNTDLTDAEKAEYQEIRQKYVQEEKELKELIQEKLWSEDGFFFNIDSTTGEYTNIATPTGLWALAAGVATQEQADEMIQKYAENSNKMFRPNGLSTVCYDYESFKPTGGYWNGAMWSPTSYQWLKGLEQYGYDDLAFEEAVRHVNALADVCVNGAYDRNGSFLNTLWENYSSEYSIPGSTEYSDSEPSRSNFVGWTGAIGIASVIEDIAGITVDAPEDTVDWDIRLTEAFGIDNLYFNGTEGENFVSLSCAERVSDTSAADITVKADHPFKLHVTVGEQEEVLQVEAGEHSYQIKGTDGEESYLGVRLSKSAKQDFSREKLEQADSAVLFGEKGSSVSEDGLPDQIEMGKGSIFNVNTVGYKADSTVYPTRLRESSLLQEYGIEDAREYVKTTSPDGEEGFMFMAPASNEMQTVKALIGVKNGEAEVEADLLDASEETTTAKLSGGDEEQIYEIEIPYCAAGDTKLMVTVTMAQGEKQGEISLKAILMEQGGSQVLASPVQVSADTEDGGLLINAEAPKGESYDQYRVYYKEAGTSDYQMKETDELPCHLEGLENYKRYSVFVTGVKKGVESSASEEVSQIPEKTRRSDAQRAYSDWQAVREQVLNGNESFDQVKQALNFQVNGPVYGTTFRFTSSSDGSAYGVKNDGSISSPLLPMKDMQTFLKVEASCAEETINISVPVKVLAQDPDQIPYVSGKKGEETSGTVDLTEEGSADWVQFCTADTKQYARKNQEDAKIRNFEVIDQVDGKVSDAPFAFHATDGTQQPTDYSAISARGLSDGFTFELPYSDKMQKTKIYTSVWGGDITLEIAVDGKVCYQETVGKDTSSGMLGQSFEISYKVPSVQNKVTAKLYCSSDLGEWGGCVTAIQAITLAETDEDIPTLEVTDEQVVMEQSAQPAKVDLTSTGNEDWRLFQTTDPEQIERKKNGSGIENLSVLQEITKVNENASDAVFCYSDGTFTESGRNSKGVVFEQAGNGVQFDLAYKDREQEANIYLGAWSAKVKVSAAVQKDGQPVKTYETFFDTGEQAGGTPAKYAMVTLRYLLEDPESVLHVEICNDTLYDTTWGNMNLGAITLKTSFTVEAEATEHGKLIITNPNAETGEKATVFALPDEGYQLEENSLRYYVEGSESENPIQGESFVMPAGNVTVKANFTKIENKDEGQELRNVLNEVLRISQALDISIYTGESVQELTKAQKAAEELLGGKEITEEEAVQAIEAIRKAIKELVPDTSAYDQKLEEERKKAEEAKKAAEEAQKKAEEEVTAAKKEAEEKIAAAKKKAEEEIAAAKKKAQEEAQQGSKLKKGQIFSRNGYTYKITNLKKQTAEVVEAATPSPEKIVIRDTVRFAGKRFKVTSVAKAAFKGNKKITEAVIGKNVKTIGKEAFFGCSKIKKITIKGKALKKAGKNAFRGIKKNAAIKTSSSRIRKLIK